MRFSLLLPLFAAAAFFAQPARHPLDPRRSRPAFARCATRNARPTASGWPTPSPPPTPRRTSTTPTSGWSASTASETCGSRPARKTRLRRAGAPTANIWRSFRRGPARQRATRSGCSTANGGEAAQLTDVKGRLQSYEWSPDSRRLALVIGDPDPDADTAGGRQAQNSQAHRDRPLPFQAGWRGLLALRPPQLHLPVRHRDQETGAPHRRQVRRIVARLVARRRAHRLREQKPDMLHAYMTEL